MVDVSPKKSESANLYLAYLDKDLQSRFGDEEIKHKGLNRKDLILSQQLAERKTLYSSLESEVVFSRQAHLSQWVEARRICNWLVWENSDLPFLKINLRFSKIQKFLKNCFQRVTKNNFLPLTKDFQKFPLIFWGSFTTSFSHNSCIWEHISFFQLLISSKETAHHHQVYIL